MALTNLVSRDRIRYEEAEKASLYPKGIGRPGSGSTAEPRVIRQPPQSPRIASI